MVIQVQVEGVEQVISKLQNLEELARDPRKIWDALAEEFVASEREVFAQKRAGSPWRGLTPRYARWKARNGGGQLMVRSGKLRDSLTRRPLAVEKINSKTAELGTNVHYARFHRDRRVVWFDKTHREAWKARVQRLAKEAIA